MITTSNDYGLYSGPERDVIGTIRNLNAVCGLDGNTGVLIFIS